MKTKLGILMLFLLMPLMGYAAESGGADAKKAGTRILSITPSWQSMPYCQNRKAS